MLPPELIALRDFGAVVALADHWPVVHVTKIPTLHAYLGIAALPAFRGVFIDPGFAALAWLDATLPPQMPVTLVMDLAVPGLLGAFAHAWGSRISHVIIQGHNVQLDPIPDMLARCVNVESVTIESTATPAAAAYLAAMPTHRLRALRVRTNAVGALDASAIVAWLQGPSASSLLLDCGTVRDPIALARAIQTSPALSTLSLVDAAGVRAALATSPHALHHITALALSQDATQHAIDVLGKVDWPSLRSLSVRNTREIVLPLYDIANALSACSSLKSVTLYHWLLPGAQFTGVCPHLSTASLGTVLGKEGVLALARALPAWMARGLEILRLDSTWLHDKDAMVLAVALASGKNRRPLTIDLLANNMTIASAPGLLTALGACRNVKLRFGTDFAQRSIWSGHRLDGDENIRDLIRTHQLQYVVSEHTFLSPSRVSSPWQLV
ncbi:hypothetical protein SPRG_16494 [Saprolegnia parasitica CBS 223.65]|uniref:Uncharacterized protein n=1 Tax=Saprolegnia parasitica (strain CBS 223.65) TaxID=695850 RepID=A0A067BIX2_SAPPC|nr:hypothetical protein SPRG_16494 [Saprolegnia parasitica CBS 223.65]KDO18133.1 hypothetical protein SPRG_16494 [Saprolegnia parasitica CBS 223.65]|eukprot:XP_012211158.1 hypothetical protein SPRG_16494 [Saprolegnia parasitica CBS 223.65]